MENLAAQVSKNKYNVYIIKIIHYNIYIMIYFQVVFQCQQSAMHLPMQRVVKD